MTDDAFLRETYAVQRLAVLTDEPTHAHRRREYLIRRAALTDQWATLHPDEPDAQADALRDAHALINHDRTHDTTAGPTPAHHADWQTDPRGYTRQEHTAWTRSPEETS